MSKTGATQPQIVEDQETEVHSAEVPAQYGVSHYPNPIGNRATILYALPHSGVVKLALYDMLGRHIQSLYSGYREAGTYQTSFDTAHLPAGLYVYTLNYAGGQFVKKMIVAR